MLFLLLTDLRGDMYFLSLNLFNSCKLFYLNYSDNAYESIGTTIIIFVCIKCLFFIYIHKGFRLSFVNVHLI